MNKEGRIINCNDQQAQSFGLRNKNELIGKNIYDVANLLHWNKNIPDAIRQNDLYIMKTGQDIITEEKVILNGEEKIFLSHKRALKNSNNKCIGVLGTAIDITQLKNTERALKIAKEQAERANKLKSEFISNMEHDLRTPSSGIMGMTKILEERETDPSKKEVLHMLSQSSERLLNILNGILAFDKAEAGIIPTTDQEFSINKTISDILAMEQPYVVSKKLELTAKYDKNIPEIVIGDEQRIFRVLLNLIGNAVKFTKKGRIDIYVKISKVIDQHSIMLQLIVEDTGIGIPKNKIKDIFERFVRGTPSNQGVYEGSGLGLSVVKRFIEDMNGEIEVKSAVGKGTKFICNIPVKLPLSDKRSRIKSARTKKIKPKQKAIKEIKKPKIVKVAKTVKITEEKKSMKSSKPLEAVKLNKRGIRVLLTEDDILAQTMASDILKGNLTDNLDVANSGKEAIKFTSKNKYDLIFMDIGLSDMDGCDVAYKIRKSKTSRNQKTVIVALTAHTLSKGKKRCFDAQINYFLTKPLNVNKIKEVLTKLLHKEAIKIEKVEKAKSPKKIKEAPKFKISKKMLLDNNLLKIEGKIIDLKFGMKKTGCDVNQAKERIKFFIKILKKEMAQLVKAKNKGDWEKIKEFAHKHRGGGLYCGVPRLQQAFTNLEHYIITEKTELREQLYQQLLDEIVKLYAAEEKLR